MKQTITITADSKTAAILKKMVALKKENREQTIARVKFLYQKN